jgi:hypothetical protein
LWRTRKKSEKGPGERKSLRHVESVAGFWAAGRKESGAEPEYRLKSPKVRFTATFSGGFALICTVLHWKFELVQEVRNLKEKNPEYRAKTQSV